MIPSAYDTLSMIENALVTQTLYRAYSTEPFTANMRLPVRGYQTTPVDMSAARAAQEQPTAAELVIKLVV